MSKFRLTYGLLIAGTIAALSLPVMAQTVMSPGVGYTPDSDAPPQGMPSTAVPPPMMAPPAPQTQMPQSQMMPQTTYMAPPPSRMPGSLGTLQSGDMAQGNAMPPPNGMMQDRALPPMAQQPQADSYNSMQQMQAGNIRYVTGGIGDEERNSLKEMEADYDLHIMSASREGAFVGDTQIKISSGKDSELLTTVAGPIFFADLPSGRYTIVATNDGQTKSQTVNVTHGKPAKVHFSW